MSKILLGKTPDGRWIEIDLEVFLDSRLLLQANSGGGKSYGLKRLIEQLFGKVQILVIDREGEFAPLCDKYDFLLVGEGHDIPAEIRSARMLAEKLLELRASAIIDLYEAFRTNPIGRLNWVRQFLMGLVDAPKHLWHDVVVIVDEAHLFCPEANPKAAKMEDREIIQGCKDAMIALATVGRKRGQCAVWATQRLAKLDKDASAELLNRMVGMTMEDTDVDRAIDLMSVSREDRSGFRKSLRELEPGNFYVFGRAITKERLLFKVGKAETHQEAKGRTKKIYEPPAPSEKVKALLAKLGDIPKEVLAKARTEGELRAEIVQLKAELIKVRRQAAVPAPAPVKTVEKRVEVKVPEKVEVPVVREAEIKRLEGAAAKILSAHKDTMTFSEKFHQALLEIRDEIRASRKNVLAFPARQDVRIREAHDAFGRAKAPPMQIKNTPPVRKTPPPAIDHTGDTGEVSMEPMSDLQVRQLRGLLDFERIGIQKVERRWLSGWLGMSLSGHFKNEFGQLHKAGRIRYEGSLLILTDEGRKCAEPSDLEMTNKTVLDRCASAVSDLSARQLRALHGFYPAWIRREELAEHLGMSLSGHFKNEFGQLHKAGMIEYGLNENKGKLRCSDWLFVEQSVPV